VEDEPAVNAQVLKALCAIDVTPTELPGEHPGYDTPVMAPATRRLSTSGEELCRDVHLGAGRSRALGRTQSSPEGQMSHPPIDPERVMTVTAKSLVFAALVAQSSGTALGAPRLVVAAAQPTRITSLGGRTVAPVRSITLAASGRAFVVGGSSGQDIFLVDTSGKAIVPGVSLSQIGAPLGLPAAAVFEHDNTVLVMDSQSPNWARLTLAKGRWTVDAVLTTELGGISGVCSSHGRMFVMGKRGESRDIGIIHEMTHSGTAKHSFGKIFGERDNPALAYGHMLCANGAGGAQPLILATSRMYPEVRAYTLDGTLKWTSRLPEYRSMGFLVEGRAMRYSYHPDSLWDQTISLLMVAPEVAAIQVGRRHGRNPVAKFIEVRTMLLSTLTGEILGVQSDVPMSMASTQSKLFAIPDRAVGSLDIFAFSFGRAH
jgi:hypothetical protein